MESFFPILIAVVVVSAVVAILMAFSGRKGKNRSNSKPKARQAIIREATKKLAQDPHSSAGLIPLADLYYREHLWDKALPLYDTMINIAVAHPDINVIEASLREGICAIKCGKIEEAFKGLLQARKLQPDSFEVNFYLGQSYYLNKEYDKSIPLLKKALLLNKEVPDTFRFLGLALYKFHSYKESLPYIKKSLDINPDDKELLFSLADAMNESGSGDRALKIFMHLRPDPDFGAKSCLSAGILHENTNQNEKAISDYEIGLKHTSTTVELQTMIRYRLAHCYLKASDMSKALVCLKEIQLVSPNYKDVATLITRYQELNQNVNLQTYLIAGNSDFINLCRKIVSIYFGKANVRIIDINATNECTEVQTEIETVKWEDNVVFRFYRTTGSTGELFMRDFHARIRDIKAGHGICFTAGNYTEEARKFIEGRPIDLVDKSGLIRILNKIS